MRQTSRTEGRRTAARALADLILGEMTTSGMIATVPTPMGGDIRKRFGDRGVTPYDPDLVDHPTDLHSGDEPEAADLERAARRGSVGEEQRRPTGEEAPKPPDSGWDYSNWVRKSCPPRGPNPNWCDDARPDYCCGGGRGESCKCPCHTPRGFPHRTGEARTRYRNGDPISLQATGCNGCSPSMINRHLSHETGCPDAFRDYKKECRECGADFFPADRGQTHCDDCSARES